MADNTEAQYSPLKVPPKQGDNSSERLDGNSPPQQQRGHNHGGKKRKRFGGDAKLQHGSRNKRRDLGRREYFSKPLDKRARNEAAQSKREKQQQDGDTKSVLPTAFPQEEIAAEERRPKRKVAVMIGYSGSGYKGMQIMPTEKTIEGDLFTAFVAAGAISKANADDPKKSALVRCARTDKGVHAAGNVISLKLIVEDEDIVEKINSNLSPQIRVWGIERTIGSFSCYQACDSRWYEYLIPTHCSLPPHPSSYLGKKLVELAEAAGDLEGYKSRQEEVADFWAEAEEKYIKPVLDSLDEPVRALVLKAINDSDTDPEVVGDDKTDAVAEAAADVNQPVKVVQGESTQPKEGSDEKTEEAAILITDAPSHSDKSIDEIQPVDPDSAMLPATDAETTSSFDSTKPPSNTDERKALDTALKRLKSAYIAAKQSYRLTPQRHARLQSALNAYIGTHSFHNYTIQKRYGEPSAKRVIRSFVANPVPILRDDTEWLSLKIHGQSFMMHQIRKMVGMAALVVRCGCPTERIGETLGRQTVSVPKAPGLGLLLERPVFESYNRKAAEQFARPKITFEKYEKEMSEFKDREIYDRIFREEAKDHVFHNFFAHIDNYKESYFLFLTSGGILAAGDPRAGPRERKGEREGLGVESEDEDGAAGEG